MKIEQCCELTLRRKIFLGYIILIVVIGSMVSILVHERQRIKEIEAETSEIRIIRKSINAIHHHKDALLLNLL